MFKKILVPLDGSENSELISGWVEGMAKLMGSKVMLLAVVDPRSFLRRGMKPSEAERMENAFVKQAESYMENETQALNLSGIIVSSRVEVGNPSEVILETADSEEVDLIAMATHRSSAVARGMLGSVTDRVVRSSSRPVLTIRPRARLTFDSTDSLPGLIIVPLDGSKRAESAIPVALDIAKVCKAEVVFLEIIHVSYPVVTGIGMDLYGMEYGTTIYRREALAYLDRFLEEAKKQGIKASAHAPIGNPAHRIVELSEDRKDSIIVMTSRGMTGVGRMLLGSVADKVVRNALQPVILVSVKNS